MKLLRRHKDPPKNTFSDGTAIVLALDSSRGMELLIDIVKQIRPSSPRQTAEAEEQFRALLKQLQVNTTSLFALRKALLTQFTHTNLIPALTESGIISSRGFVQELLAKLKHKLLPALIKPNDFLYVINHVFYLKHDYVWIENIDRQLWIDFFELLGIQINLTEPRVTKQLNQSLQILSYRIANLGLEKEMTGRTSDYQYAIHPFIEQSRLINLYIEREHSFSFNERKMLFSNIQENLHNCTQSIRWLQDQRGSSGTSLAQTFITVRLQQQIERMLIIMDALDRDHHFNTDRFIDYFQTIIRNENRKNSVWEFLSQNLGLVAYQIAEHKGVKGEKYITNSRKDFMHLFKSAMGGGVIISFTAVIKNLMAHLSMPIFWQGFWYGTNYAAGFVIMDQTGATLATKQPAYTASAVASSLDSQKQKGRPDLNNLAFTVAKVSRSQIASFAGNLLVVFPLTYVLAWLYHLATGYKIADNVASAQLLADQHPYHSFSLLYACFTGFFLFVSGLIAGYVENHVVYGQVGERLKNHPFFTKTVAEKRWKRWVDFWVKHSGTLAGSISLGFFLGFAGPIGKLLGIPFDIRHITISAANTGIGFYGVDHNVSLSYIITVVIGVLLIGFFNFLVSFGLAFFVAVKSRGIRLKDYPEFLGILRRYFFKHPGDFIRPPKK